MMFKTIKNILGLFKTEDLFDPFEGHQDIVPIKKSGISFIQAIEAIKNGQRVRRPKWRKDVSIGKRLSKVRNSYQAKLTKFVMIQGKSGAPGKWTPWLEDLYANDWEIYSQEESCGMDPEYVLDALHEMDKGE